MLAYVMTQPEIESLFEKLMDAVIDPKRVAKLRAMYLSSDTPSYKLSIVNAAADPYNLMPYLKNNETGLPLIKQLAGYLTVLLLDRGYRNNIKTHQEHCLCGSSGSGQNPTANEFPYTVGAILNTQITVKEARKARELESPSGAIATFWGIDDWMERDDIGGMLLPPIDDFGITVRDPVLVDKNGNVIAEKLVEGAPFRR